MKYNTLKKCNPSHFISNMQEISDFYAVRKKVPIITNTERLVNIIRIFFETLLFYIENSPKKFIVNIKKKQYQAKINGHKSDGQEISLDLEDISEQLIKNVILDLAKTINPEIFCRLVKLLNSIILTSTISPDHKLSILNCENSLPEGKWYTLIRQLPEKIAIETIEIRITFIFKILKSPNKYIPNRKYRDENLLSLHNAYELYLKTLLRIHIANNHFDEIKATLINSLESVIKMTGNEFFKTSQLVNFLLTQLVLNNNLFQFERKDDLREIVNEYTEYIEGDLSNIIQDGLDFDPECFEIGKVSVGMSEPDFSKENLDEIRTIISFVVPYETDEKSINIKLNHKTEIIFSKIKNVFDDPIYSFLDSAEMSINGLPLTFFSDSIGQINQSTRIDIIINAFYHPDFEIIKNKIVSINHEKEEARRGGLYHPHKDLILDLLWEIQDKKLLPIEVKKINSEFISNYFVSYFGQSQKPIHHKLFTITNFNSYFNAKNRFIKSLNAHYMSEDMPAIRSFILDTKITSKKSFFDFSLKFLELTLKKAIEFGGMHSAFWENKLPISEPHSQPIIYNLIRFLAEMKGIRISREVIASDGSLDFHFSYTKNDILMNVCVELKNAHHGSLEHGITAQLPLYMRDIGSKEGIFLVLWYKSKSFNKPTKFNTIKDIETFLNEKVPKKYRIKPIIIDCSPKVSPSLKASKERLS